MKNKTLMIGVIFLSLIFAVNCNNDGDKKGKAPGIVDGDIITLKAVVPGTLQKLDLKEGAAVTRDKEVASINSDKVENQLTDLDIRLKEIDLKSLRIAKKISFLNKNIGFLSKQVQRFQRLKSKHAVPGEKLEALEIKLFEAKTTRFDLVKSNEILQLQKEKIENKRQYLHLLLDDHRVVSPVEGVVLETFVSQGEKVFPGTAIADILDTSSLFIEVFIEEGEMAALKLNQMVRVEADGLKSGGVNGTISYFGKKAEFSPKYIISETERKALLYQVKIRITGNGDFLKIGMPVTVIFKNND